jgi:hypothetical protein
VLREQIAQIRVDISVECCSVLLSEHPEKNALGISVKSCIKASVGVGDFETFVYHPAGRRLWAVIDSVRIRIVANFFTRSAHPRREQQKFLNFVRISAGVESCLVAAE